MNENYIPLYRKYRPQTLEEIVGQEHIKKALANTIKLNKISHAYLFTGPRGTGKTSTARIFAKSLNCVNGPTVTPCGKCENCVAITNSTPIDVIEIDAASNRSVEDAQNILEKVMYAPVNSRYKIYIIDEVHMLSTTAFNALLKTLEEPPQNVIFILATTEVHKVLDTIKSRCQRFDFKRITTDDIVKHLRKISTKENINITDEALMLIAKNSAGGMRDSIALLDQLSVLDNEKAISVEDINLLLGRISFDKLKDLSDCIINSKPEDAVKLLNTIYNSGNEPIQILTNLLDYLKNLLIVKTCEDSVINELTQLNEKQITDLKAQTKLIETHQIISLINKCSEYIKELKTSTNPQLWLEISIIDMSNLTENTTLANLQKRITRLEGGAIPSVNISQYKTAPSPIKKQEIMPVTKPKIEIKNDKKVDVDSENKKEIKVKVKEKEEFTPPPISQKTDKSDDISTLWNELTEKITSTTTRSLLTQWVIPIKITAEEVELTVKNDIFLNKLSDSDKRESIMQGIKELFGDKNTKLNLRLASKDDKPVEIKKELTDKPKIIKVQEESANNKDNENIEENEQEFEEIEEEEKEAEKDLPKYKATEHSDEVNMVKQLFEGKIID